MSAHQSNTLYCFLVLSRWHFWLKVKLGIKNSLWYNIILYFCCWIFQKISAVSVPTRKVTVSKGVPSTESSPSLYPFTDWSELFSWQWYVHGKFGGFPTWMVYFDCIQGCQFSAIFRFFRYFWPDPFSADPFPVFRFFFPQPFVESVC